MNSNKIDQPEPQNIYDFYINYVKSFIVGRDYSQVDKYKANDVSSESGLLSCFCDGGQTN